MTKTPHKPVIYWLYTTIAFIVAMIVIGGITRLTDSGLSMVEWRPFLGFLPPLSDTEWNRIFELYRNTSEYQLLNKGMGIDGFKDIFWWEYIHRVWGRLIGLVYGGGLLYFALKKALPPFYHKHFYILLCLGALQAIIGWWMVKSGFKDRIDVSTLRLMVHLSLAFLIVGYLYILARAIDTNTNIKLRLLLLHTPLRFAIITSLFITIMSGAIVAGSHAGAVYDTWPLIGDNFLPHDYSLLSPFWHNLYENPSSIQFNHRTLAYITLLSIFIWRLSYGLQTSPFITRLNILCVLVLSQVSLGITTIVTSVHFIPAITHQLGAAILLLYSLYVVYYKVTQK